MTKKTPDLYEKMIEVLIPLEEWLGEEEFKKAISPVLAWFNSELARKAHELGIEDFDPSSYRGSEGILMALEREKYFLKTLRKKIEEVVDEHKEKE